MLALCLDEVLALYVENLFSACFLVCVSARLCVSAARACLCICVHACIRIYIYIYIYMLSLIHI